MSDTTDHALPGPAGLGHALRDLLGDYTPPPDPYQGVARRIRARRRARRLAGAGLATAAALLAALTLAACGADGDTDAGQATRAVSPGADLRGTCPPRIVIQTNWWPQAEYGAIYHLLGDQLKVDTDKKRVSAPLVSAGRDTGVRLEIRAGGPATSYQQVSQLLYLDPSITLGGVATDEQVQNAAGQPTLAVFAPMDLNPQILLWDPGTYPQFNTIADIGQTDVKVLYLPGRRLHGVPRRLGHPAPIPARRRVRRQPGSVRRRKGKDGPAGVPDERALRLRTRSRAVGQAAGLPTGA